MSQENLRDWGKENLEQWTKKKYNKSTEQKNPEAICNKKFFLFLRWVDLVPGIVDRYIQTKDCKLLL